MVSRVQLGLSPVQVAPLGVGCWAWGDRGYWHYEDTKDGRDIVDAFRSSLDGGLDFFDTAEAYGWGKSEKILGSLARRSQRALVLATKYAPLSGRGGPAAIEKGFEGSLRRLGVPHIDLYQLHWPDLAEVPIPATMNVLADLVQSGRARAIGVSNFSAAEMREAHATLARRGVPLATNQVRYSLLHRAPEVDGVLDACRDLDVTLLAYSPLEQGLLTGKYSADCLPPAPRAETPRFATANIAAAQPVLAQLRTAAQARSVEIATVALAWLLAQPGVVPLAGARNGMQAARNAAALHISLSEEELSSLDQATLGWRVLQPGG